MHAKQLCNCTDVLFIFVTFIAAGMRDHECALHIQALDQLDGMLDPFAPDHARRLKKEKFVRSNIQVGAQIGRVFVRRRGWMIEIHHVRDDRGCHTLSSAKLGSRQRIDHHVTDGRQPRRKGHFQVIANTVHEKAFTLPREIVMMADGRDAGLGNQLRDRQPKRDIHRDRGRIFHDQHVDIEFLDELVELMLDIDP